MSTYLLVFTIKKIDVYTSLVAFYSQNSKKVKVCIVDSTPIPVCHNLRIKSHKVCKDNACRSKPLMGWYYGFKLHTIINHKGEIVKIYVSEATLDDRKGLKSMVNGLKGIIIGDKGYLSKNLK